LTSQQTSSLNQQNIDTKQLDQTLSKIEVDPQQQQAYADNRYKNHKDSKKNTHQSPAALNNSTPKTTWIWPALGTLTLATVGSDGSKRGLDIKGRQGSSVVAAASGKVVYAGNALKGYGNLVIIKHDDQYLSAYAHNESILVGEQIYVNQGQKIATMGNSGASEIMLHFEIRKKGQSVDPFAYLPAR
jgi:lipoprotein NlpD